MKRGDADYRVERIFGEKNTASPQETDVQNLLDQIYDEHEAQLKAKDKEIEKLKVAHKGYLIVLNDKLDRNNFLELQYEKYRKTLAMLFWGWREYKRRGKSYEDEAQAYEQSFHKAYAMLKGNA